MRRRDGQVCACDGERRKDPRREVDSDYDDDDDDDDKEEEEDVTNFWAI